MRIRTEDQLTEPQGDALLAYASRTVKEERRRKLPAGV
jgi:hypothetical protein